MLQGASLVHAQCIVSHLPSARRQPWTPCQPSLASCAWLALIGVTGGGGVLLGAHCHMSCEAVFEEVPSLQCPGPLLPEPCWLSLWALSPLTTSVLGVWCPLGEPYPSPQNPSCLESDPIQRHPLPATQPSRDFSFTPALLEAVSFPRGPDLSL